LHLHPRWFADRSRSWLLGTDRLDRRRLAGPAAGLPGPRRRPARTAGGVAPRSVRRNALPFEVRLLRRAGDYAVVECRLLPQAEGILGVARDFTTRGWREREAARAGRVEAVGRVVGGVAHHFNNLLTTILGFSDLLLQGVPPGRVPWRFSEPSLN